MYDYYYNMYYHAYYNAYISGGPAAVQAPVAAAAPRGASPTGAAAVPASVEEHKRQDATAARLPVARLVAAVQADGEAEGAPGSGSGEGEGDGDGEGRPAKKARTSMTSRRAIAPLPPRDPSPPAAPKAAVAVAAAAAAPKPAAPKTVPNTTAAKPTPPSRPSSQPSYGSGPSSATYCANCHTTSTPLWRKDRATNSVLCNACGIYLKTHGRPRPVETLGNQAQHRKRMEMMMMQQAQQQEHDAGAGAGILDCPESTPLAPMVLHGMHHQGLMDPMSHLDAMTGCNVGSVSMLDSGCSLLTATPLTGADGLLGGSGSMLQPLVANHTPLLYTSATPAAGHGGLSTGGQASGAAVRIDSAQDLQALLHGQDHHVRGCASCPRGATWATRPSPLLRLDCASPCPLPPSRSSARPSPAPC